MSQPDMDSGTSGHVEFEYNDTDFSHADEKKKSVTSHTNGCIVLFWKIFFNIVMCLFFQCTTDNVLIAKENK